MTRVLVLLAVLYGTLPGRAYAEDAYERKLTWLDNVVISFAEVVHIRNEYADHAVELPGGGQLFLKGGTVRDGPLKGDNQVIFALELPLKGFLQ